MSDRAAKVFYDIYMRNRIAPYIIILLATLFIAGTQQYLIDPAALPRELIRTAVITIAVGYPAIWYTMRQHSRVAKLSRALEVLSTTDQMTGLLNRQTFLKRLDAVLRVAPRGDSAGAFAYLDADHFKSINDRFGHGVGDKVIIAIADSMKHATRREDLLARIGGEEFAMFLPRATVSQAADAAERLREGLRGLSDGLGIDSLKVTVSIGIASHKPGADALALMQEADGSLYAAKHGGRDSVVIDLKKFRAA